MTQQFTYQQLKERNRRLLKKGIQPIQLNIDKNKFSLNALIAESESLLRKLKNLC